MYNVYVSLTDLHPTSAPAQIYLEPKNTSQVRLKRLAASYTFSLWPNYQGLIRKYNVHVYDVQKSFRVKYPEEERFQPCFQLCFPASNVRLQFSSGYLLRLPIYIHVSILRVRYNYEIVMSYRPALDLQFGVQI